MKNSSKILIPKAKLVKKRNFEFEQIIPVSTLLHSTYLHVDLKNEIFELSNYSNKFYENYLQYITDISKGAFGSLEERLEFSKSVLLEKHILKVLAALGWGSDLDEVSNSIHRYCLINKGFEVANQNGEAVFIKPEIMIFNTPENINQFQEIADPLSRRSFINKNCKFILTTSFWNRFSLSQDKFDTKSGFTEKLERQRFSDSFSYLDESERLNSYLDLLGLKFGAATDGFQWRLQLNQRNENEEKKVIKFNFGKLINEESLDVYQNHLQNFYWLFSKESHLKGAVPKIEKFIHGSQQYASGYEKQTKNAFLMGIHHLANGLAKNWKIENKKRKVSDEIKITIRDSSESFLFNLLFIRSCENKAILPVTDPRYIKYSLNTLIKLVPKIESKIFSNIEYIDNLGPFSPNISRDGYEIYNYVSDLFQQLYKGNSKIGFGQGFEETVFSVNEKAFLAENLVNNEYMIKLLKSLFFMDSNMRQVEIPYHFFAPRELGSIYESFLEFQIDIADKEYVYQTKKHKFQWNDLNVAKGVAPTDPRAKKGELYFKPNNTQKKSTGTFYTPDHVVKKMVDMALAESIKNKSSKEILNIKVCDPAMGSGHFLIGALNYIVVKYLEALKNEGQEIPTNSEAKRIVLDKCIFGLDINSRAVKLAKMSLWLESAHPGKKLERLDDQLYLGDALKFSLNNQPNYDVVLANPPYAVINSSDQSLVEYKNFLQKKYKTGEDKFDYYTFFIEAASKIVKKDGVVAMITPNTFLNKTNSIKIRDFLLNDVDFVDIYDYGFSAFKEAVHTNIIKYINRKPLINEICYQGYDKEMKVKIEKSDCIWGTNNYIKTWMKSEDYKLFKKVFNRYNKLGDLCEIYNGIQTGNDSEHTSKVKKGKKWLPALIGRDLSLWSYEWSGTYVNYIPKNLNSNTRLNVFDCSQKIIIRQTCDRLHGVYDKDRYFSMSSTFIIKFFEDENLKYTKNLLGLVNSKFYLYLYRLTNFEKGRVLPQIKKKHIFDFPVPSNLLKSKKLKFEVDQLISGKSKSTKCLDKLVYNFFDLSADEIEVIESNELAI